MSNVLVKMVGSLKNYDMKSFFIQYFRKLAVEFMAANMAFLVHSA